MMKRKSHGIEASNLAGNYGLRPKYCAKAVVGLIGNRGDGVATEDDKARLGSRWHGVAAVRLLTVLYLARCCDRTASLILGRVPDQAVTPCRTCSGKKMRFIVSAHPNHASKSDRSMRTPVLLWTLSYSQRRDAAPFIVFQALEFLSSSGTDNLPSVSLMSARQCSQPKQTNSDSFDHHLL